MSVPRAYRFVLGDRIANTALDILEGLVEGALQNELRLLEVGIRRSAQRLQKFEACYGLSTADFVQRYAHDELEETLEFAEWIGEYRLRARLLEKADALRAIRFAD